MSYTRTLSSIDITNINVFELDVSQVKLLQNDTDERVFERTIHVLRPQQFLSSADN